MSKPTPLTNEDIKNTVLQLSAQASGSEYGQNEIIEDRKQALKYYFGRGLNNDISGSSQAISKDVADTVDGLLAQLASTFSSDNLVTFEPSGEEDAEQAALEDGFVNDIVMSKNNGFILFQTLLKDTFLSKNCTAKVTVNEKVDIQKEAYTGLNEQELFVILQPTAKNQEVDVTSFDEAKGDVKLKRINTVRTLDITAVAPENFAISTSFDGSYLEDTNYCRERYYKTKGELVELGYDLETVYNLAPSTTDTQLDSVERNTSDDETTHYTADPSLHEVEIFEHYVKLDKERNGDISIFKVITANRSLLDIEEVDWIPYANGVSFLLGHRYYGQSVYDKIKDIQDSKTEFLRQWHDNALVNNHNKTDVVEDQVEMEDFTSGRPNAVRRVESLDSARDIPTNDIGPSCQNALSYMDKVRTDRTGSVLDLQSNQVAMPSNVGNQGVNTLVSNLEMVGALAANTFSETLVVSLYRLVHKTLRTFFKDELSSKIGVQWQNTVPTEWKERNTLNVSIPPTPSLKLQQSIAIKEMIGLASAEMGQGKEGITTDDSKLYAMKLDLAKLAGIDNPEKYWINPTSPQAQAAREEAALRAQRQEQMAMQFAQEDRMFAKQLQVRQLELAESEINRNLKNDIEELQFKLTELQENLRFDYDKLEVDTNVKLAEGSTKAEMEEAKLIANSSTAIAVESLRHSHKVIEDDMDSFRDDDGRQEMMIE